MRLYDIASDLEQLITNGFTYDEETGEILLEESDLDSVDIKFDEKLEGVGLYIKNTKADIDAIGAEIKVLQERKRVAENKIKRLEDYTIKCMKMADRSRLETPRVVLSQRHSKAVRILDEYEVPVKFKTIKQTEAVDKKAIKKAIENGENVNGAEIEERLSLTIR